GVGAEVLKFSDIRFEGFFSKVEDGKERIDFVDLIFTDVDHPGSDRGTQPFVQARTKIIAPQISLLVINHRKRLRAVHDNLDPFAMGHLADLFYRKKLARVIDGVSYQDQARFWGNT